jgi:hypothetical protein
MEGGRALATKNGLSKETQDCAEPKEQEEEELYVLPGADGCIRAELMLTPSMVAEINARRRQRGVLTADWEQRPLKQISSLH